MENGNIFLNQIIEDSIREITPLRNSSSGYLSIDEENNIKWVSKDDHFEHFNFYHRDGRIGIGREPLFTYNLDIKVLPNTLATALHIGDGSAGFSMGNGTSDGFIPEIIGLGINKTDAGLYFLGKTNSYEGSSVPLIIMDGRGPNGAPLVNRPIFGITNADYSSYKLIVDNDGKVGINRYPKIYNLEVEGSIQVNDVRLISSALAEEIKQYMPSGTSSISLTELFLTLVKNLKKQSVEIAKLKKNNKNN